MIMNALLGLRVAEGLPAGVADCGRLMPLLLLRRHRGMIELREGVLIHIMPFGESEQV
jgi:hypothetical protein